MKPTHILDNFLPYDNLLYVMIHYYIICYDVLIHFGSIFNTYITEAIYLFFLDIVNNVSIVLVFE